MRTIDKLYFGFITTITLFVVFLLSYELGKKHQCEIDRDYLYSFDFSKCVKIGAFNIKGSLSEN